MKTRLITVISLVLPFILWGKLMSFSLAQDDYYLISQAVFNSLGQQILSSLPNLDSIFFRPLGMQAYFYLMARLFWTTAWKYRIIAILVHGINSILVYKISQKIIKSGAVFVWLMYLISPWQFTAIGWIVNISYLTGTMFAFLSILSALKKRFILSILFFVVGMLTNELVAVVPLLMILLRFANKRRLTIPIFIILGLYGTIRLNFLRPQPAIMDLRSGLMLFKISVGCYYGHWAGRKHIKTNLFHLLILTRNFYRFFPEKHLFLP